MNEGIKYRYGSILLGVILAGISIGMWGFPHETISKTERRQLAVFPEMTVSNLLKGDFEEEFETYLMDHFPMREELRSMKSYAQYFGFLRKEVHGIYWVHGYGAKALYPMNQSSLNYAADKFKEVYETYLKDEASEIYLSVIPDKSVYLGEGISKTDLHQIQETLKEQMEYAKFIDLSGVLTYRDYYRTDTHWRQDRLVPVAQYLLQKMGVTDSTLVKYSVIDSNIRLHGIYEGQSGLMTQIDEIRYIKNQTIEDCVVKDINGKILNGVYDDDKLTNPDAYDLFLSGAQPLITIENPHGDSERKLIIFRDSFGSSLTPLLLEGYGSITLIDLRYLNSSLLGDYVDFQNAEVFFLYSTILLNDSFSLK